VGEMLGPAVEHLAHLLAYAVADGLTARDVIERPIYHPTVEEALTTALTDLAQTKNKC
jgi:dihydrolipoamide dehydrogenase